jgi:hypothetical protein
LPLRRLASGQTGLGLITNTIPFPLAAVKEGAEMVDGQEKGKTKTYQGKDYQDPRVKVCLGDIADNPQGKEQHIDRTDTVQDGENKQQLGYVRLLLPKLYKPFHRQTLLDKPGRPLAARDFSFAPT